MPSSLPPQLQAEHFEQPDTAALLKPSTRKTHDPRFLLLYGSLRRSI